MSTLSFANTIILALGLLGGAASAGYFIEQGAIQLKTSDRYITVKGLAQQQVKANLGVWEIDYREVGNNLLTLSSQIGTDQQNVINFLHQSGFNDAEIEIRPTKVNDLLANPYNSSSSEQAKDYRYIVLSGVRVRTNKVDQLQHAVQLTGNLIKEGVPLNFDTSDYASDLSPNPSYLFTQLDAIRPQMLATATQSAFAVAQQFATDSHSQLAGIRRANQGVFQVFSRDANDADNNSGAMNEANSIEKKVRLVTTIDYFLATPKS